MWKQLTMWFARAAILSVIALTLSLVLRELLTKKHSSNQKALAGIQALMDTWSPYL